MSDPQYPLRLHPARGMSWAQGVVVLALALGMTACSGGGGGGEGGAIEGLRWVLERYDVSGTITPVPAEVVADARFGEGQVSGFGGCNSFSGAATVSGASLAVGPIAATQMACIGAPDRVEAAYLGNLGRAASFTATAESLSIFDARGRLVLVYRVAAANPVAGAWKVTGIHDGREAVVSPQLGTTVTIRFSPDGRVEGEGGCTPFAGTYTIAGQALRIAGVASTRESACEPPVLEQERLFFDALGRVTTLDASGRTLMLRDDAGAMQVVLSPD